MLSDCGTTEQLEREICPCSLFPSCTHDCHFSFIRKGKIRGNIYNNQTMRSSSRFFFSNEEMITLSEEWEGIKASALPTKKRAKGKKKSHAATTRHILCAWENNHESAGRRGAKMIDKSKMRKKKGNHRSKKKN